MDLRSQRSNRSWTPTAPTVWSASGQILAQLAQGQSRIKEMVAVMYAAVDPRLHPAAAHSVLAHLVHLVHTGKVVSEGAASIDGEFHLAA